MKPHGKERPMPADFVKVCKAKGNRGAVVRHFKCGEGAMSRWLLASGHKFVREVKPTPADFVENALTMCEAELIRHYKLSYKTIHRMLDDAGIKAAKSATSKKNGVKDAPVGFTELAPTMCRRDLERHCKVSSSTMARWLLEYGVKPMKFDHSAAAKARARAMPKRVDGGKPHIIIDRDMRRYDEYDAAADKLRRLCPVHRCDDRGNYDEKGQMWRFGMTILTPEELLARADKMRKAA